MTVHSSRRSVSAFGPFELDLEQAELRRGGTTVHLSPQPLKLLVLLVRKAGEVVTREEICAALWGGDTFVDFEQGVNHCIRSIRAVLEEGASSPRYIETLPRRGYRFIGPIAASTPDPPAIPEAVAEPSPAPPEQTPPPRRRFSSLPGSARRFFLWIGGVAQRGQRRGVRLAILPFENLTGDPQRGCMISGITEEIGTRLTQDSGERLRLLPSWSVKGLTQAAHPVSAARQEGVDFLLGGSVRSAGERARVNAQLVRVYDDIQLWAESYERPMGDVLDFQSEVAHLIADGARGKLSV